MELAVSPQEIEAGVPAMRVFDFLFFPVVDITFNLHFEDEISIKPLQHAEQKIESGSQPMPVIALRIVPVDSAVSPDV
jgi:hypothetical protein